MLNTKLGVWGRAVRGGEAARVDPEAPAAAELPVLLCLETFTETFTQRYLFR